ncbi:MAG: hypothetical protein KF812_04950 [Fimbriimonadaceae bacterium]|nr:hypothetical protein [Fimbriimonadaceae bacterium]
MRTLLAALVLVAVQPVTLKRTPSVGETTNFEIRMETEWEGKQLVFTGTQQEVVKVVNLDGTFEIESTQSASKVIYDEQEMEGPKLPATIFTYAADNTPTALIGEQVDADAFRLTRVTTPIFPSDSVPVGGTWSRELRDDPDAALPGVKLEFTYEANEKVGNTDTYRIKIVGEELEGSFPTKVDGQVWVSSTTGAIIKASYKVDEAPVAGNHFDLTLTISPIPSVASR